MARMTDAAELARNCARALFDRDRASKALAMTIEDVGPGWADVSMTVRPDMTNGMEICHGGFLFTLCDSSFAFACNSYDRRTVAAGCSIDFLSPVPLGEKVIAQARERSRSGRTGVYDVSVINQAGELVAVFRGRSYEIRGSVQNSDGM